jgi:serine/threonine protein phosphatase 1
MTLNPPSIGDAAGSAAGHASVLTCAIGDVHGQIGKLELLLDHCERRCAGHATRLLFIGDYVDRGPDSRAVVELLRGLQRSRPRVVICRAAITRRWSSPRRAASAYAARRRGHGAVGPSGGGLQTLASYENLPRLAAAGGAPGVDGVLLSHDDGLRYFAHAGVHPERSLAEQVEDDLLDPRAFPVARGSFGRLVVHGHTPLKARVPDLRTNRLNIDTGAGYGGPIAAAIFDDRQRDPVAFLTNAGEIRLETATHG